VRGLALPDIAAVSYGDMVLSYGGSDRMENERFCVAGLTAVIGLGYVGLPLALDFCASGIPILGLDLDQNKVNLLNSGKSYISYIASEKIESGIKSGNLSASIDFGRLREVENIIIAVPTPLNEHREPDLSFIINTTYTIADHLQKGQLIVLESTTYPGTSREVMLPILEKSGLRVGHDFYLAYSPERVDPASSAKGVSIPKVVGGITEECLERCKALYGKVFERLVPVSSTEAAEASKLLENIFRSVNIALVNELKLLFERMGIDIWEVIEASATKPFGYMPFYPGPGLGGHCIPIDPFYLSWKAREYDFSTRFIELAGEINTGMPYHVLQKVAEALNEKEKSIKGSKILVLGAAYKKDVDDIRESPSVKIITLLQEKGAEISFHDPYIPVIRDLRDYPGLELTGVELTKETLVEADCILLLTDHSSFDLEFLLKHGVLIIDTRNAFKDYKSDKIVKA
jgi:UDP-N-acetyl-D-glucosamine dehydrogenase